ncbi:MAG: hypothetical protein GXO76_06120 [Calditrichaeota bacterium]|nr:hypothetical protein [Calditrichota bacterium]
MKITEVINGKEKELYLCEKCALSLGLQKTVKQLPELFQSLMVDVFKEEAAPPVRHSVSLKCPHCGTTWDDFKRTGLLGCDRCYEAFRVQLERVLKQIHGNTHHMGSRPSGQKTPVVQNLERLQEELKKAVAEEAFEKAARLRDQIRELQGNVKQD